MTHYPPGTWEALFPQHPVVLALVVFLGAAMLALWISRKAF